MSRVGFREVQPILGTRDIERAIEFYVAKLGFTLAFKDDATPTNYIAVRRDGVELHVQFQYEDEMTGTRLRVVVDDPDALCAEYQARGVVIAMPTADTAWGTREFAIYDPDRNALTFYRARNGAS